ncbi:MAG: acyl-CoA dehydrogenase [Myxococcales bacterium]|nr:MAG: acyl-CoA dehydrogenase [Myxococcales bacterium]
MILLNPKAHDRHYPDERSREIMLKTIEFFETKGKRRLKDDDHGQVWYQDFLDFVKRERIFATMCTPAAYGAEDCRWDTWRICEFSEILAFYGLHYWYTWQVSVLGLGPIWMSENEEAKRKAARQLEEGEIFAFGLSERAHGADLYSSDMKLASQDDGSYVANGAKYYIGNGNKARMVSTFAKMADSNDWVFFTTDSQHPSYKLNKNVITSQSYVSDFELHDYPIAEEDILSRGPEAWDAALNTVNVGKFNLGWASIGICTHAFYEAVTHAHNRVLYGKRVTEFPQVRNLMMDAYSRLVAMKLVGLRAADYMRSASSEDRRYLLFNPIVKMKVTTQGEDVIDHLWDVIAARGFEEDTYFEMATRDIRALPKLEGTVHVNIALIVKFLANYFFNPAEFPEIPRRDDAADDAFLFQQGATRGLGGIQFHDYRPVFDRWSLANVEIFKEQIETIRTLCTEAPPSRDQSKDLDFLLAVGEIFILVVYGQLILENAEIYEVPDALVNQIFDVLVRDMSHYALDLYNKTATTAEQMEHCLKLVKKPIADAAAFDALYIEHVTALSGAYEMNT